MSARTEAEFDYEICSSKIRPIAEALIKKYDELHHIDPDKILFVVNHKSSGSKKQMTLAKTTKISPKWTELLYQLGSCSYFYMIEFYAKTTAAMDESQMVALVYRELRRIGPEGERRPRLVADTHGPRPQMVLPRRDVPEPARRQRRLEKAHGHIL